VAELEAALRRLAEVADRAQLLEGELDRAHAARHEAEALARSQTAQLEASLAEVERFAARERALWEELAMRMYPTTPQELAQVLVSAAKTATGPQRTLTLARYAILVESAIHPALRAQLLATGGRVNTWFMTWLRVAGSTDPERDAPIIMNHYTGLVLHDLAIPDPAFDPTEQITTLVTTVIRPQSAEVPS